MWAFLKAYQWFKVEVENDEMIASS